MGLLWAMTLPGLVTLLVALAALERFGLWAGRRSWLPWRRSRSDRPELTAAGLDQLGAALYHGKQLELDQRRTELMLRAETTDPRINLDANVTYFRSGS